MSIKAKIVLDEEEIPKAWYNIQADMPALPEPPLNPMTKEPIKTRRYGTNFSDGDRTARSEYRAVDSDTRGSERSLSALETHAVV